MKPEDQKAFDEALVNRCKTVVTVPQDFEAGWNEALAHRDAQPAAAINEQLVEALNLADAALEGAHMNADVVYKKVKAAIAAAEAEKAKGGV